MENKQGIKMKDDLIRYYKDLHQIPEESFNEFNTHKYLLDELKKLNCRIFELEPTGLLAFFDYNMNETIAFRCEMDGLNIFEENNIEYCSKNKGYMHACGHDAHMAIMLAFAKHLNKTKCFKNICLIFQPSEEKYGGALKVINSKPYKELNIKEVYGLHLWPGIKEGIISSRRKVMMASSTEIDISVIGKSSHIANMNEGIDSIKSTFELLNQINSDDVLFNCGKIITTGARNIVCPYSLLQCSLRTFYKIRRKKFLKNLSQSTVKLSEKNNVEIMINSDRYIPEVKNDVLLFERFRHLIDEVCSPVYQAEDFSFYGLEAKTLFLFLGVGNTAPLHSSKFNFDLNVLEKGLKVFINISATR